MALIAGLLLFAPLPSAIAQECLTASPEVANLIAKQRKGQCEIHCSGCGCKGGPGYRSRDKAKQCVSWKKLVETCGPAPHRKCDRECKPVVDGCDAPKMPKGKELAS
jgi:hypothetical protein